MTILENGELVLLSHMGDDNTIVSSARVSFLGESKGEEQDSKLIKYLLEHKHWSPFEHVFFTFRVKCPIFVRSQWMRHVSWSFNEVSRRYTSEKIDFYVPKIFRKQNENNKQSSSLEVFDESNNIAWNRLIQHHSEISLRLYEDMLESGVVREQARMVLPQNLFTIFYASANLRSVLHFLESRLSLDAQQEIREYAEKILELITPIVPITISKWRN